jgi:hypothetical protein
MRQCLYVIKVQLLVTKDGIAVEFGFVPGSEHDARAFTINKLIPN